MLEPRTSLKVFWVIVIKSVFSTTQPAPLIRANPDGVNFRFKIILLRASYMIATFSFFSSWSAQGTIFDILFFGILFINIIDNRIARFSIMKLISTFITHVHSTFTNYFASLVVSNGIFVTSFSYAPSQVRILTQNSSLFEPFVFFDIGFC